MEKGALFHGVLQDETEEGGKTREEEVKRDKAKCGDRHALARRKRRLGQRSQSPFFAVGQA